MKKYILAFCFLFFSTNSLATTNYAVTSKSADGDFSSLSAAETVLSASLDTTVSTTKVFSFDANSGTIPDNTACSTDSGATTGTCVHQTANQMLIKGISSGTFDNDDVVTDGSNTITLSDSGDDATITLTVYNDVAAVTWDGGTYSATNYLLIQGDTTGWDSTPAGGVHLTSGTLLIKDPGVIVKNLVIDCSDAFCYGATGVTTTGINIIMDGGGVAFGYDLTNQSNITCVNCVSIDSPGNCFDIRYNNGQISTYNCTCLNSTDIGFENNRGWGPAFYSYNNLCLSTAQCYETGSGNYTSSNSDYNACSDTTCSTFTHGVSSLTTLDEITSTSDIHLKAGNTISILGSDTSATTGVDYDIDNVTRANDWSIGADEYIGNPEDTTPPVISNPSPTDPVATGVTSVEISIDTDENATCRYSTTTDVAFTSMDNTFGTTGGTTHSETVSGLQGNLTYHYYIRCIDQSDNYNTVDYDLTFDTDPYNTDYITAIWANSGEDKVTQDDLRMSNYETVTNNFWNGTSILLHGAKNETVAFNVIMEAQYQEADNITIEFDSLTDGNGNYIKNDTVPTGDEVFDYVNRPIETFYVRYLEIIGIGRNTSADSFYDERHISERMRRPGFNPDNGIGATGSWVDRPDANKFYPDILIPYELEIETNGNLTIAQGNSQAIWVDIYIPKTTVVGTYTGNFVVKRGETTLKTVPVSLIVNNFELTDSTKAFTYIEDSYIYERFLGKAYPEFATTDSAMVPEARTVMFNLYKLAHRNRIGIIDIGLDLLDDISGNHPVNKDRFELIFSGDLFTSTYGYDGPGVETPNDIYSIGTYGAWRAWVMGFVYDTVLPISGATGTIPDNTTCSVGGVTGRTCLHQGTGTYTDPQGYEYEGVANTILVRGSYLSSYTVGTTITDGSSTMTYASAGSYRQANQQNFEKLSDDYETFFQANYPDVERFIYLTDEPTNVTLLAGTYEDYAGWVKNNEGVGGSMKTMITTGLIKRNDYLPSLTISFDDYGWEYTSTTQTEHLTAEGDGTKVWLGNGVRPKNGTMGTDDDGVAPRVKGWTVFKHNLGRDFFWQSVGWCNRDGQSNDKDTNVFVDSITFGRSYSTINPYSEEKDCPTTEGAYGCSSTNQTGVGDGVLFYPGKDVLKYPATSYGADGVFASQRVKVWRRGHQDEAYLEMAYAINPEATDAIVEAILPAVGWEVSCDDQNDCSYGHADISWSTDPDVWDDALQLLTDIIIYEDTPPAEGSTVVNVSGLAGATIK